MKILFTGCTSKQTDDDAHLRAHVKRIDDSTIICESLKKQGFSIDRKRVRWGDDLSEYSLAIVGIGAFGSSNYSKRIFGALYAISKVDRVLIFHEDWKITETMSTFTKALDDSFFEKAKTKKWSNGQYFYDDVDHPDFDPDLLKKIIKNIVEGKYDALIPAFDWGNKQLVRNIIKSKNIYNVDLTPYVLQKWNIPLVVDQKPKEKKHMLASLVDHRSWVKKNKLKWNVDYYGAKTIENAIKLETEFDVFEKCGEYWSILCPEYPHAGSGWFRIRWVYAAIHKSILLSSPKDLEALGLKKLRHFKIEELDDKSLTYYANEQAKAVLSHMWTVEQFDKKIYEIIESINS